MQLVLASSSSEILAFSSGSLASEYGGLPLSLGNFAASSTFNGTFLCLGIFNRWCLTAFRFPTWLLQVLRFSPSIATLSEYKSGILVYFPTANFHLRRKAPKMFAFLTLFCECLYVENSHPCYIGCLFIYILCRVHLHFIHK